MRSVVAVLTGLVITIGLVMLVNLGVAGAIGIPEEGSPGAEFLTLNLIGSALAGMAGGATAMRLAPHTPHGHVVALAIVILLLSLPTLLTARSPGEPTWYGLVIAVIGPVSVILGGMLGVRWREAAIARRAAREGT